MSWLSGIVLLLLLIPSWVFAQASYTCNVSAQGETALTRATNSTHQGLTKAQIVQKFIDGDMDTLVRQQNSFDSREVNDKLLVTTTAAKVAARNAINAGILVPTIQTISNQTNNVNDEVSVPVIAADTTGVQQPDPMPLKILAQNLPPGVAVRSDITTGEPLLKGIPTTQGTYNVTVRAYKFTDIFGQTTFTWTINP